MKIPLQLVGTGSPDETRSFLRAERINWYPEAGPPDAREKSILRTGAGLTAFCTGLSGGVRGTRTAGEVLYVVAGETLYSVTGGGVATALGTVLGSSRCDMTDGFIPDTSRQIIIGTGERGYIYDTVTGFVEITDANFVARAVKKTPKWVNSYTIWPTDDGALWSDLSDAAVYPALNFLTAETVTDGVVGLGQAYGDVWIGGTRSIDVMRVQTGSGAEAFRIIQTIDYGFASPYGMTNADNGSFFLEAKGRVYRSQGMTPARVSTHQIEQYLSTVDFTQTWAFSFVDRGHEFVGFSVPSGETHLYDVATGIWSRRKTFGIDRWRVNAHALCYGFNLFGDYSAGTIWKLDAAALVDGDLPLVRELYSGYVHAQSDPIFISCLDLVAQVGEAAQTGDQIDTDPIIEMRYSDDGGHNWSNFKQRALGKIGEYMTRIRWHRLGQTRQRIFHIRISDPVRADLISVTMDAEKGEQA